jgi:hypothetical protein
MGLTKDLGSIPRAITVSGSNNNVGVSKEIPNAKLDINGNTIITGSLNVTQGITGSLFGTATTASFVNIAGLGGFVQGGNSFGAQALIGTNDNQSLALETNGTVRMFVSSSGNVGIRTTDPRANLEVEGGTGININNLGEIMPNLYRDGGNGGFLIRSYNKTTNVFTNNVSVTPEGRMGIGTTAPQSLNAAANHIVLGGGSGNTGATIFSGTSSFGSLHFADGTNGSEAFRGYINYDHTNDLMNFGTGGSGRMGINSSGTTFIHGGGFTTSIQPNNQINSYLNGSGTAMYLNFQGNGPIYAGSNYAVLYGGSDRRIKSDIKDAQPTLNKLLSLTPKTFRYKERPEFTNYGFIAQEVEEIMPEIVKTSEGISMCNGEEIVDQKSIESYGLAWASILVKAIQEQQALIKELQDEMVLLKNK